MFRDGTVRSLMESPSGTSASSASLIETMPMSRIPSSTTGMELNPVFRIMSSSVFTSSFSPMVAQSLAMMSPAFARRSVRISSFSSLPAISGKRSFWRSSMYDGM